MDWERNDFFSKKISNSRSFKRKSGNQKLWIWIVLIVLLWCGFGWYKLFYETPTIDEVENPNEGLCRLWETIYLKGELKADGDIITHTHTITTEQYGVLLLRSKSINLWEYHGQVELTGKIEKCYQETPIIEVDQLSGELLKKVEDIDIALDKDSWKYYTAAGIHFLPTFFDDYVLLNDGENGEFLIQNLTTEQIIPLNYFRCNDSDPNRNCKNLISIYSESPRSFVTSNGDAYYKASETNSRLISNGNWWGVMINDVPEEEVMQLKDHIVFVNEKIMKNWMDFSATRICQNEEESLQKIETSNIVLKQDGLIAIISGMGKEYEVSCEIKVDFSLPKKGVLLSLTKNGEKKVYEETREEVDTPQQEVKKEIKPEENKTEEKEEKSDVQLESPSQEEEIWDPNVPQFPINPEKWLKYTRKGNYTVNFSSSNISYAASSVREKFGKDNVNCTYVINVIKYSDRDNLEISPDARIYECSVNGEISSGEIWQNFVVKEGADKTFIIQVNNPAWLDFANALSFDPVEE